MIRALVCLRSGTIANRALSNPRCERAEKAGRKKVENVIAKSKKKKYVFRAFDPSSLPANQAQKRQNSGINLSYCPPEQSVSVSFGKQIYQLRKPTTYWALVQKYEFFSWKYIWVRSLYLIGISYLVAYFWQEIMQIEEEQRGGGRAKPALAGEVLGKQMQPVSHREMYDEDRMNDIVAKIHSDFSSKSQTNLDDYEMVKIKRPKQLTFDDVRKR